MQRDFYLPPPKLDLKQEEKEVQETKALEKMQTDLSQANFLTIDQKLQETGKLYMQSQPRLLPKQKHIRLRSAATGVRTSKTV